MTRYRLTAPIQALLDRPGEQKPVRLPAGALLEESAEHSTTLLGTVGVYWEGRHYSVYPMDLLRKAERVSSPGSRARSTRGVRAHDPKS